MIRFKIKFQSELSDFKVSTDQDKMVKTAKLKSAEDVQVIGHSLGGQTAGYAGKFYQTLSGEKVGKLTGLDPAGPFFEVDIPTKDRELIHLYRTDANFVDVIHTTGEFIGTTNFIMHSVTIIIIRNKL